MKRKIEKTTTIKEFQIEQNGSWLQIGEKTNTEITEIEGTYLEDELMKQQSKYNK